MITYTSKDAFLEIPKGLGNFSSGNGGGGGQDLGPLSGSVVTLSATTEAIESNLDTLSGSVETLSGSVETLTSNLGDLSGATDTIGDAVADLLLDVDNIDGRVSANTENIAALSAVTQTMEGSITAVTSSVDSLSGAVTSLTEGVEAISASTSANTAQIEALSAVTSGLSETVSEMAGKQASIYDWDAFYALNDYSERRAIYSAFTQDFAQGKMVLMKGTTSDGSLIYLHLEKVNTSSPYNAYFRYESDGGYTNINITSAGNDSGDYNNQGKLTRNKLAAASASTLANSAYTRADSAYTLASSAYTLADSLTGQTGGPRVILLNDLSQQERVALYNELASKYDYVNNGFTSAYTASEYAFYIDLRTYQQQQGPDNNWDLADHYEGFFPMQLSRMHPSDYGGAAFFVGVESNRVANMNLINFRYVITYDGEVDAGCWKWFADSQPQYMHTLDITSVGTIRPGAEWWPIGDDSNANRIAMKYDTNWYGGDGYSEYGMIKWRSKYKTTYNGEQRWYYVWSADVPIGTTIYTGVWGSIEGQWNWDSDVPPQVLQWTSGATYESQTYPPDTY